MSFAGMNPAAIALAALAALLWSALYFRLAGGGQARPTLGLLLTALVAEGVAAWVLAGTLGHLGPGQVTLRNGVITALFVWAGFMATTLAVSHRRQGAPWRLVLADAGHWLGAVLLMGAVIGAMGV